MRVAHILPPKVLDYVSDFLDYYALLLPSLASDDAYRAFYKAESGYKIMDNGVAEEIIPNFAQQVFTARMFGCEEIVLPDVMKNMDATLNAVASVFYDAYQIRNRHKFMLVAQGQTELDCVSTVARAMNMFPSLIGSIGIPRHILSRGKKARVHIARAIREDLPNVPIHLLGTHPNAVGELLAYKDYFANLNIRGVDTSLAWNATRAGVPLRGPSSLSYNLSIARQPITAFRNATIEDVDLGLLQDNLEAINEWVK